VTSISHKSPKQAFSAAELYIHTVIRRVQS
jgi:hypothetical protein